MPFTSSMVFPIVKSGTISTRPPIETATRMPSSSSSEFFSIDFVTERHGVSPTPLPSLPAEPQ